MDQKQIVKSFEARAAKLGIPMYGICRQAGVAATTYYRWQQGSSANLRTLNLVGDTLDRLEKEKSSDWQRLRGSASGSGVAPSPGTSDPRNSP